MKINSISNKSVLSFQKIPVMQSNVVKDIVHNQHKNSVLDTTLQTLADCKKIVLQHAKKVIVKDVQNQEVPALIVKPKKDSWYMDCKGNSVGNIIFSISKAPIKGDNFPVEYVGKPYLFVNSLKSTKQYKGVGSALIKEAVKESKRLGCEGRVCLNTTMTNPRLGSPVPFYSKLGFEATDTVKQNKILSSLCNGSELPIECGAVTMFLPEAKISEFLK